MASSADTADFYLRLHEEVNAPATRARDAVQRLSGGLVASQKELSRTEAALSRFYKAEAEAPKRAAEKAAQERARELRERHDAVRRGFGGLVGGVGGALLGGEAGEIVGALAGGHGGLIGAGFGVATAALTEMVELGKKGVETFIELTAKIGESAYEGLKFGQNMRLAFGYLVHDKSLGVETFNAVRKEAQDLALNVEETTNSFRSLLAAQFSVGQSHALVKMAADMKAIGSSDEEIQRILYAMREIKDLGTLQKRQLRQLEMAGISGSLIEKHLELQFKTGSPSQLDKLRKKGKLSADLAIEAIKDAVKEKVGEANLGDVAAEMGTKTIGGMLSRAQARISNFFIDLGARLEPSATRVASRLFGLFEREASSPAVSRFADYIVQSMGEAEQWIDSHWGAIEDFVDNGVNQLVNGAMAIYDFVKSSAGYVIDNWTEIKAVASEVAVNVWNLVAPFVVLAEALIEVVKWGEKFNKWNDNLGDSIGSALGLDSKFGRQTLGYESNADQRRKDADKASAEEERSALEANRARTLALRQTMGIEAGGAATANGSATGRSISIGNVSMPININGADHHDTNSLTGDLDERIRKNFHKLMESMP